MQHRIGIHENSVPKLWRSLAVFLTMQVINDNNLHNVTLVGHSLAGLWMQLVLQQMQDRIGMMVFVDAIALETGESFFDNQIAGVVPTYPIYPAQVSPSD